MVALILADGDAPTRAELDAAWPGWDAASTSSSPPTAAPPRPRRSASRLDLWVGDGDSLGDDGIAALAAAGVPIERSQAGQGRDRRRARGRRRPIARGAGGLIIVGALGGERVDHALANVGLLASADLVGRPAILLDARSRISLLRAPGPGRRTPCASQLSTGDRAPIVSLLPFGGDAEGVTTDGLVYPLARRAASRWVRRAACRTSSLGASADVTVRRGLLLVVESPATL